MDQDSKILLALGRLEGKVDALISQQSAFQTDIKTLENRVRTLEGSKAVLIGACGVVASAISFAISYFT